MPINNITQTISAIPNPPHRGVDVQTAFVIKQEDFQDHLTDTTVTELNTLKDQLNSRIVEINSTTTTMNDYANTASAGASTATTKAGEASTSAGEALTSRNQAETFKNNASASATKASQWADNNYNVEVETGKYSAKHWSVVAQNTTANKIDKVASTDNAIVRFDGITGSIQNSSVIIDDNGNVGIGTSSPATTLDVVGTAPNSVGIFSVRPNGAGTLGIVQARNSSDATNYSFGQIGARVDKITIDSSKSGTGTYLPLMLGIGGNYRFIINTTGDSLHISPYGGLGYGTGAGGTVTQLTSKSTPVTLNKPSGQIIMNSSALAAGAIASFQFLNSLITTSDMVIVTLNNKTDSYNVWSGTLSNGSCYIDLKNIATGSYSEAVVLNFSIIKGANA